MILQITIGVILAAFILELSQPLRIKLIQALQTKKFWKVIGWVVVGIIVLLVISGIAELIFEN